MKNSILKIQTMSNIYRTITLVCVSILFMTLDIINALENEPTARGIITLDSVTFNKTLSAFPHSFVSFTLSSFTQSMHQLSEEQNEKVRIDSIIPYYYLNASDYTEYVCHTG